MTEHAVLITGASTGFGRELALALPKAGHIPIASMRDIDGRNAKNAAALQDAGVKVVEIDVTDDASVERGVGEAASAAGRIDVLINNAGYGVWGPVEAATVDDLKAQFDTNVFGVHRMVRAVTPMMKQQGSGLLVHVSSGAGRVVFPGSGVYCASKWALEALAEGLRYELAHLGVDSVIIEPGPYATEFHKSVAKVSDAGREAEYAHVAQAQENRGKSMKMGDPSEVIDAIISLIDTPRGARPTRVVAHPLQEDLDRLNSEQAVIQRKVLAMFQSVELESNGV
ncbi:MAG TPA: SDR family oxidoreductase [Actinomycetota bacterium]|nr:SDR family oxidoreductase [Actinomycetota bacterium]